MLTRERKIDILIDFRLGAVKFLTKREETSNKHEWRQFVKFAGADDEEDIVLYDDTFLGTIEYRTDGFPLVIWENGVAYQVKKGDSIKNLVINYLEG